MTGNQLNDITMNRHNNNKTNGLKKFLDKIPVIPNVVLSAQELLNQTVLDIDELTRLLESDPAIVAKILCIANSSFYGLSREIKSVRDACIVLGQYTLRNILMTATVASSVKGYATDKKQYQLLLEHCIKTANIARLLADKAGHNRDEAYIVGLLHDIGSIFIELIDPDDATLVREGMQECGCDIAQMEREYLGFDHAELSGEVARYWNLPEEIAQSLQYHHDINACSGVMNDLIYIADYLAMNLYDYESNGNDREIISDELIERAGLTRAILSDCIQSIQSNNDVEVNSIMEAG